MRKCYRGCLILLRRGNKVLGYELAITFVSEVPPKWVDCEITWSKTKTMTFPWQWIRSWDHMIMRGAVRNKRTNFTKRGTSEMTLDTSDRLNESGTSAAPRWESALCFGSRQTRAASWVCCFFRSQHNLNESLAWPPSHRSSSSPPDQPNPPVEVEQCRTGLRSTVIYPRIKGHCSL